MSSVDDSLASLFEPFEMGGLRLRNRVFVSAHTTNFGERNLPTARLARYLEERAAGGVGLVVTEGIRVHPASAGRSNTLGCFAGPDAGAYRQVVAAVHGRGAAIFAQLLHLGRQAGGHHVLQPALTASPVPWAEWAHVPHEMTPSEIETVVRSFGAAARHLGSAGFDGFEVHLGHGHLLQQFLSPAVNRRSDGHGGALANRLRLPREVLGAVLAATDLPVGVRISADEFLPGGLDLDAMLDVVARLARELRLAYVHVSHSAYVGERSLSTQIADMSYGPAPFRSFPAAFKRAFPGLPVLAICRIDDVETAASMLARGEADLVGMTRAHIADPRLLAKVAGGRPGPVRSCIACNQGCIGRTELGLALSCVVNPEVGLEGAWDALAALPPPQPRRTLVVGGGPAGLQAALTAARAGHAVRLVEAAGSLGGQVRLASSLHGRARLGLLVRELERDVRAAGVEVLTGSAATVRDILDGPWEAVIVATGGRPPAEPLAGSPDPRAVDVAAAVAGDGSLGAHPAVFDEDGGWGGIGVALHLAASGRQVTLVAAGAQLGWRITTYSRVGAVAAMRERGMRVRLLRRPVAFDGDDLLLLDTIGGELERVPGITALVHARMPAASSALAVALEEARFAGRVWTVGDAYAPRSCLEAVREGHLAGTEVGREAGSIPDEIRWQL